MRQAARVSVAFRALLSLLIVSMAAESAGEFASAPEEADPTASFEAVEGDGNGVLANAVAAVDDVDFDILAVQATSAHPRPRGRS